MKHRRKPSSNEVLGRFMMVASTLMMAGFLFMGGVLSGAGGTGVFGERVAFWQQVLAELTVVCGMALLPIAFLMLRREPKPYVVAALAIVVVDLVAFMLVQRSSAPMFGLVYAVVLGIAYKIGR